MIFGHREIPTTNDVDHHNVDRFQLVRFDYITYFSRPRQGMCEFCNDPQSNENRDASHQDFAGFFSADAIDLAVQQANASRQPDDESAESDEDSDGT
jgi:hypothetical protein